MARHYTKRLTKQTTLGARVDTPALYIRVSTESQAAEGYSLDDQRARLIAYCVAQGWTVDERHIYVDAGISGKSTERPDFQRMIAAALAGDVNRVVAMKLDRLARNVRDFLATVDVLKAAGVDLVLIKEAFDTGTPHGKFALTMFAAMAELEAATIAERVAGGRKQKALTGGFVGARIPYGYTYDGATWTIDTDQAATVRYIFSEFNSPYHHTGLGEIAQALNNDGVPTQRGGKWYASTVRYILSNGHYAGLVQYDGQEPVTGTHPAIITVDTYKQAQRRLDAIKPGRVPA